jgi:RNA polymerase sigma factor (sigma-70 family)
MEPQGWLGTVVGMHPHPPVVPPLAGIIRAAARGDERAWETLVRRFTPLIRRTAQMYRLGPHEVDDVVQACWLALFTSVRTLREPEALAGWLVTTARRQALRMRQREVRELLTDAPRPVDLAAPDSPEHLVLAAELAAELRGAMSRLPDRQRTLLEALVVAPERSYAEMSAGLGMPIGSIGPTRERGLRRLRRDQRLAHVVTA